MSLDAKRKKVLFTFLAVCTFCIFQKNVILATSDKVADQIEVRRHFSCYHCNISWGALSDLENNPIFNACLEGATLSELEGLGIEDLNRRLEVLQNGNLLKKTGDQTYRLAFPVIVGEKRTEFQKIVERTSQALLPSAEKMIEDIRPCLNGHEEMLYHVVWSTVMDGSIMWNILGNQLKKQIGKDNISLDGIGWLIYPSHPYRAGTNTYGDQQRGIIITWTPTTPMPKIVQQNLEKYYGELLQAMSQNKPITDQAAKQAMAQYGLVDDKGMARAHVVDANSQKFQTYAKTSIMFGSEVMNHLNVQEVAGILGASPEEALVITYHEICYELLKQLAVKNVLEVPEIAMKAQGQATQMYRLISIISISGPNTLQRLIEGEF